MPRLSLSMDRQPWPRTVITVQSLIASSELDDSQPLTLTVYLLLIIRHLN